MKVDYYITRNGVIERKQNTVYFIYKEGDEVVKKPLPVEKIRSFYITAKVTIKSGALSFLMKNGIVAHFFNKYGWYEGTFYPREKLISGDLIVRQVENYLNLEKRMAIAREFVRGSIDNMILNLRYYSRTKTDLSDFISTMEKCKSLCDGVRSIQELMAMEGNARDSYYKSWDFILRGNFEFEKRSRRPPENMVNAMISYGNSLLYSACISEIYNTQLHPAISYLHEPFERRFSLALDIAEIFKPLIVDRLIFKVVNKQVIKNEHFVKDLNSCILNDHGKRLFLSEYERRMNTTVKHRTLGRNVSYRRLIRLECYKLIKHLLGIKSYRAFRMWW